MGKMALAQYRARKAARSASHYYGGRAKGQFNILPAACERVFRDGRLVTRVVAALLHNVPHAVIAHDLRIPRRAVRIINMREQCL